MGTVADTTFARIRTSVPTGADVVNVIEACAAGAKAADAKHAASNNFFISN